MINLLSGLGVLAALAWVVQGLVLLRNRRPGHWLADVDPDAIDPAGGTAGLTVIFAARDEADGIEAATRSLLAQDHPAFEILAIDDRSTDGTGTILDRIAADDPRLRVLHVESLPAGWLGKVHALDQAAAIATTPWLLFTDADVVFAPGAVRKLVAWAEADGADHVTVVPELVTKGVGERIFLVVFHLAFSSRVLGGRVERGRTHLGIGACNLVRAEALRALGGFERIRLSVDDDNRLAQMLKATGHRGRALMGADAVAVRWQRGGVIGLIRGLEKNAFSFLDFRTGLLVAGSLAWLVIGMAPLVGLFVGPWWARVACGLGVAALAATLAAIRRQTRTAWPYALTFPITVTLYVFASARSAWLTIRRGGIRWRGSFYPLPELRDHVRGRNAWLRQARQAATARDLP